LDFLGVIAQRPEHRLQGIAVQLANRVQQLFTKSGREAAQALIDAARLADGVHGGRFENELIRRNLLGRGRHE
jgi:hypothetical protein